MKGIVYVAGPFRAKTEYQIRQNILEAERTALHLWRLGYIPIVPHKNFSYIGSEMSQEEVMDSCLEIIKRCDYIYMIPGWKKSIGSTLEHGFAIKNKIPILKKVVNI